VKRFILLAIALFVVAAPAATASPAKQPIATGFYQGQQINYFDFGPIKLKPGNKLAPIWTVTNGATGQHNIIDTVPGKADYSPLWQLNMVTFKAGATPHLLKSKDDVDAAVKAGEVTVTQTNTIVNCPVLGFGQKKVAGFSNGHVIHYYDLGPVKVAAGNVIAPLYTVTNPVGAQQHNIAQENIARGQTKYPPLWGIIKVTFKAHAKPHLLTSYAQIKKAQAAGQVTITKTSLVVNCPVVV
jgi:hypothetical protein